MRQTSLDAYTSLNKTKTQELREQILALLSKNGPMTHEEIFEALGGEKYRSYSGVRARCAELLSEEHGAKIRDSGAKKPSRFGKAMILWELNIPAEQQELF